MREAISGVVSVSAMLGEDWEDTQALRADLTDAKHVLRQEDVDRAIREAWFGGGVGGVMSVFLFGYSTGRGIVEYAWVVVGDIPWATLPAASGDSPALIAEKYLAGIERWVNSSGREPGAVLRLYHAYDPDLAVGLRSRLRFMRERVLPAAFGLGPAMQ